MNRGVRLYEKCVFHCLSVGLVMRLINERVKEYPNNITE